MGASKLDLDRVGPFLLEVTEEPDGSMIRERERKRANSIRDPPPQLLNISYAKAKHFRVCLFSISNS